MAACVPPYGIAATLSDAVALAGVFGPGAEIAIGACAEGSNILAPAGLTLSVAEAESALRRHHPAYLFSFGNANFVEPASIGPVLDLLAEASGTDFCAACFALPWSGRTQYSGHVFENGQLRADLKQALAPYIAGAIAVLPRDVTAAGPAAIRATLTEMKERGIRLALLDAINEEDCANLTQGLSRQPVLAAPAWAFAEQAPLPEPPLPTGPLAMLSGALHRQSLMQIATARQYMPVLDVNAASPDPQTALAWATPYLQEPAFLITSSVPPDKIIAGANPAAQLAEIAVVLREAGTRNFLLNGNDSAAAILAALGVNSFIAGAAFAGLRWLRAADIHFLIKPGGYGAKNLFLYDFEPQSRLNESA